MTTRKKGTHQPRHYYASVCLADGVSIRDLADYLGHGDPGFTLRVTGTSSSTRTIGLGRR